MAFASEKEFEDELIARLQKCSEENQWEYREDIKTAPDLWANFKRIIETLNNGTMLRSLGRNHLSNNEFGQVREEVLRNCSTPYEAGRWLYGVNGKTQVSVNPDGGGEPLILDVFDQDDIGANGTVYQVVNQIKRPPVVDGEKPRRFDTTLLVNGLPLIQIEEKKDGRSADEALEQMRQYAAERQYTGIFSTLQILVAMTPHDIRYMAATDARHFNTGFAFRWEETLADGRTVRVDDWKRFTDLVLSIPAAHRLATTYMVLDNDPIPEKRKLIAMRPYQIRAARAVVEELRKHDFDMGPQGVGYVWHTTGSGKTITSFKTAWLASRLPNVDKVVFFVDRTALTEQTYEKYTQYDPDSDERNRSGTVSSTRNSWDLDRQLRAPGQARRIIVTSIQKMAACAKRMRRPNGQKVVFIVDEAHRSTNGDMVPLLKERFPRSAWVGYTGTPAFDGGRTEKAFGRCLDAYTIREAIADHNVLHWEVSPSNTVAEENAKEELLPQILRRDNPDWSERQIADRIARMDSADIERYIDSSFYDNNQKHVDAVVNDVTSNWENRSQGRKYAAILTTHVKNGSSIPMALRYFDALRKTNKRMAQPLRIAVTFSWQQDNAPGQLEKNAGLKDAMAYYNREFDTHFDAENVGGYLVDVSDRLRGNQREGQPLDLVVVVDQLLTGFDAPRVNYLYVDRLLSGASLIQAYSRTNRIADADKTANIVTYRFPENSKIAMNAALSVYANKDYASTQTKLDGTDIEGTVIGLPYQQRIEQARETAAELRHLTEGFHTPGDETAQAKAAELINKYMHEVNDIHESYDFDGDEEKLRDELRVTEYDEGRILAMRNEIRENAAWERQSHENPVDLSKLDFVAEHYKTISVNYHYIDELIVRLMNRRNDGEDANDDYDRILVEAGRLSDRREAEQIRSLAKSIRNGSFDDDRLKRPISPDDVQGIIERHAASTRHELVRSFLTTWGLFSINDAGEILDAIFAAHKPGANDIDADGLYGRLQREALENRVYREDAGDEEIRALSPVKYSQRLHNALTDLADQISARY